MNNEELDAMRARAKARLEASLLLISIQQVAKQYGVSLRTLRRWQAGGLMPPRMRHGRRLKYQKAEIAELMARQQTRACNKDGEQA